jgi:hypothetical protein
MTRPFWFRLTFQNHSGIMNIWLSSTTDIAWVDIDIVN